MLDLFYPRDLSHATEVELPPPFDETFPYIPDDDLISAVNVALLQRRPLLVTGEPGVGKTQLAYHVAKNLTPERDLLRFDVKSTTKGTDLFYQYDHLLAFQDSHDGGRKEHKHYTNFNALGLAILQAASRGVAAPWWDEKKYGPLSPEPCLSVVLIDEIDKAPRDVPNDILNEIDKMSFKIAEAGFQEIKADTTFRPITILASNSEKPLPDPFLRRCVYHHIEFPSEAKLKQIIASRYPTVTELSWMPQAIRLFNKLRDPSSGLRKKPGTAELLEWLRVLERGDWTVHKTLSTQEPLVKETLCGLLKTKEDRELGLDQLSLWLKEIR